MGRKIASLRKSLTDCRALFLVQESNKEETNSNDSTNNKMRIVVSSHLQRLVPNRQNTKLPPMSSPNNSRRNTIANNNFNAKQDDEEDTSNIINHLKFRCRRRSSSGQSGGCNQLMQYGQFSKEKEEDKEDRKQTTTMLGKSGDRQSFLLLSSSEQETICTRRTFHRQGGRRRLSLPLKPELSARMTEQEETMDNRRLALHRQSGKRRRLSLSCEPEEEEEEQEEEDEETSSTITKRPTLYHQGGCRQLKQKATSIATEIIDVSRSTLHLQSGVRRRLSLPCKDEKEEENEKEEEGTATIIANALRFSTVIKDSCFLTTTISKMSSMAAPHSLGGGRKKGEKSTMTDLIPKFPYPSIPSFVPPTISNWAPTHFQYPSIPANWVPTHFQYPSIPVKAISRWTWKQQQQEEEETIHRHPKFIMIAWKEVEDDDDTEGGDDCNDVCDNYFWTSIPALTIYCFTILAVILRMPPLLHGITFTLLVQMWKIIAAWMNAFQTTTNTPARSSGDSYCTRIIQFVLSYLRRKMSVLNQRTIEHLSDRHGQEQNNFSVQ